MGTVRQREFTRTVKVATGVQGRYSKTCNSVRILFVYKRIECRETLAIEPTPSNIQYAIRLRGEILNAIAKNTFSYADYFPESKKAKQFGHVSSHCTIGELLLSFLERVKRTQQPITYTTYRKVCLAHLLPTFGQTALRDLTPQRLREWISGLQLTAKTVNNILIPLRAVLDEAVNDDQIERNPLHRVVLAKLLSKETLKSDYVPDPFNREEIQAILTHADPLVRPLWQFAFFTGLRPSELLALRWRDIDWVNGLVCVRRAIVERKEKTTKTQAGLRDVLLLPLAHEALKAQQAYTGNQERVFHHIKTQGPWQTDRQLREVAWKPSLKNAGVRYRNPYQCRHTYASLLLSAGENMLWLAKQMGHTDTEMLIKTYGKWIPTTNAVGGYHCVSDWSNVMSSVPA
jgi:integrase